MANKKISELQSRTPALSDLILVGDPSSGYSYKCTVTALATIIETDIADGYVTIGTTQTISGAKTFSNNLTLTSVANSAVDTDKFLVLNSNVVNYRTGAEVLSDIGGVGGSGTTNYLPKFSATTTLANSQIFDNGTNVGIGVGSSIIAGYLLTIGGKVKIYNQIDLDNPTTNTCNAINIQKGTSISHRGAGYIQIASFNTNRLSLFFNDNNNYQADFDGSNLTTGQRYILPNATGTLALTSDLSSYVPTSRTLTINGTSYDLSANRTWSVGTVTSVAALTLGTTGTDLSSSVANGTTTPVITLNVPTASATNRGALSSTDWSTFNNKVGGSGTTNYIPKFTSSSAIGNSVIYESSSNIGIGTTTNITMPLTVQANTGNGAIKLIGTSSSSSNNAGIYWYNSDGTTFTGYLGNFNASFDIYNQRNTPIVFYVNAAEQMRLTSTGLGIGTSSPAYKLDVVGNFGLNSSGTGLLGIFGANNTTDKYIRVRNSDGSIELGTNVSEHYIYGAGSIPFTIYTNGTKRATFDISGNLGLGVTPSAWYTTGGYANLQIGNVGLTGRNSTNSELYLGANVYTNVSGSPTYITSEYATRYSQNSGQHIWYNAPSGTAGTAISFTQAMTLNASGNLGLGVTPSAWYTGYTALQVGESASLFSNRTSADTRTTQLANNAYLNTGATNWIYAQTDEATRYGQVSGEHQWFTAPSGTAGNAISFTQAMTLDASGRLGIGTTSPTYKLDITALGYGFRHYGDANNEIRTYAGSTYQTIFYNGGSGKDNAVGFVNGNYYVETAQTERMRITSGGNVGIGTTSPSEKLDISGTGDIKAQIQSTSSGTGANAGVFVKTATEGSWGIQTGNAVSSGLRFYDLTAGSERMRITSAGNVGIGTSSPDINSTGNRVLTISGAFTRGRLQLQNTDNVGTGVIGGTVEFLNGSNIIGMISGSTDASSSTAGHLFFTTGTTERMRITSGGNVGIGTSSLDGGTQFQLFSSSSPQNLASFYTALNVSGSSGTNSAASPAIYMSGDSNTGFFSPSGDNIGFSTNGSERMRITSAGELLINTTSDAGDYKLQVNGNGYFANSLTAQQGLSVSGYGAITNSANKFVLDFYNNNSRFYSLGTNSSTKGGYEFHTNSSDGSLDVTAFAITSAGNIETTGSIKTAAPSGGTAAAWKLGERVASSGLTLNDTQYIQLDIAGTLYTLATVNLS